MKKNAVNDTIVKNNSVQLLLGAKESTNEGIAPLMTQEELIYDFLGIGKDACTFDIGIMLSG